MALDLELADLILAITLDLVSIVGAKLELLEVHGMLLAILLVETFPDVAFLAVAGVVTRVMPRLASRVARLHARIAWLDTRIARLGSRIARLDTRIARLGSRIARLSDGKLR
jgi:uncharacterized small protein (DUF1192 family)